MSQKLAVSRIILCKINEKEGLDYGRKEDKYRRYSGKSKRQRHGGGIRRRSRLDDDAPDGHEKSCIATYHSKNECMKSPDGYHFWFEDSEYGYNLFCKYCRKSGSKTIHNQTAV